MEYRTEEQKRADYENAAANARWLERDKRNAEVLTRVIVWGVLIGAVAGVLWLTGGVK